MFAYNDQEIFNACFVSFSKILTWISEWKIINNIKDIFEALKKVFKFHKPNHVASSFYT